MEQKVFLVKNNGASGRTATDPIRGLRHWIRVGTLVVQTEHGSFDGLHETEAREINQSITLKDLYYIGTL